MFLLFCGNRYHRIRISGC